MLRYLLVVLVLASIGSVALGYARRSIEGYSLPFNDLSAYEHFSGPSNRVRRSNVPLNFDHFNGNIYDPKQELAHHREQFYNTPQGLYSSNLNGNLMNSKNNNNPQGFYMNNNNQNNKNINNPQGMRNVRRAVRSPQQMMTMNSGTILPGDNFGMGMGMGLGLGWPANGVPMRSNFLAPSIITPFIQDDE